MSLIYTKHGSQAAPELEQELRALARDIDGLKKRERAITQIITPEDDTPGASQGVNSPLKRFWHPIRLDDEGSFNAIFPMFDIPPHRPGYGGGAYTMLDCWLYVIHRTSTTPISFDMTIRGSMTRPALMSNSIDDHTLIRALKPEFYKWGWSHGVIGVPPEPVVDPHPRYPGVQLTSLAADQQEAYAPILVPEGDTVVLVVSYEVLGDPPEYEPLSPGYKAVVFGLYMLHDLHFWGNPPNA